MSLDGGDTLPGMYLPFCVAELRDENLERFVGFELVNTITGKTHVGIHGSLRRFNEDEPSNLGYDFQNRFRVGAEGERSGRFHAAVRAITRGQCVLILGTGEPLQFGVSRLGGPDYRDGRSVS